MKTVPYYFTPCSIYTVWFMGLDPRELDQFLTDVHGGSLISRVYLLVFYYLRDIFHIFRDTCRLIQSHYVVVACLFTMFFYIV